LETGTGERLDLAAAVDWLLAVEDRDGTAVATSS
jgi:hypothetical protein